MLNNPSELNIPKNQAIEVASRHEIELGPAKVILNIENGVRKEYEIEIVQIYINDNQDNKVC